MKWKPALILFIFLFSLIPIIPVEAQNTYWEFDLSGDPVYVGDRDSIESKPVLELTRWGGESSFKIAFPSGGIPASMSLEDSIVKWVSPFIEVHFYELPSNKQYEGGGFEFEIILKIKPPSNAYALPIDTENLVFHYQPPLDDVLIVSEYDFVNATHAIINGTVIVHRPENVVGSYAVYHSSKRGNRFKTGKAYHIYRPELIDAEGNRAWANFTINENQLMITLPKKFLDTAKYPITIDPSFGYTTVGGSNRALQDGIRGSNHSAPASGVVTNITAYVTNFGNGESAECALYLDNNTFLANTSSILDGPEGWNTFDYPGNDPNVDSGVSYILAINADAYLKFYYDEGIGRGRLDYHAFGTWPNPLVPSINDDMYSIYCNYTAVGGQSYERNPTQSISWSSSIDRVWSLSRGLTQSLTLATQLDRTWSLSRAFSQSLTFTWNAIGIHSTFEAFVRTITLAVNWASSIKRRVDFHRAFSQSITFTWNALGSKWGEWIRTLSLSINWASSLKRRVDFHKTVSQSVSFTLTLPGLVAQTLRVLVTNLNNLAIQNALVTVSYPTSGSIEFVQYTDAEGFTSAEILTGGNYTVMVIREDYQPYNLLFAFSSTTTLEVPLSTIEEGIVMNLEFLAFMFAALGVMYYGIREKMPEKRSLGFSFSLILWIATWAEWIFDNSMNNNIVLGWVFTVPIGLCMIYLTEGAINYLSIEG